MFMRILKLNVDPKFIEEFKVFYEETVEPKLQAVDGCLFASLIKSKPDKDEFVSLTFWKTQQQAENYENSDVFKNLYEQAKKYFSEATDEWKIQLTENMEIQYTHPEDEPEITKYDVAVQNGKDNGLIKQDESMFFRIVSLKIQPGKMDEFKKLYSKIVIPSFKSAPGCRNAFLTQSINEESDFISISVWDNKESAVAHETSNEYSNMINKVKHTFSKFYLWKMSLEKERGSNFRTTDDMKIDHYDVVTGKSFI
jgi:quinol monooxygenase YgiN